MDDKLIKFFQDLKRVGLRPGEKAALREQILASARGLVPTYKETSRGTFWSVAFSHKLLVTIPVVVLIFAGISYGAEGSLPGELLYQVKVGLNEPLLHAVSLSSASQVNFEAKIAERRLTEAVTLLEENKLDENTKTTLLEQAGKRVDNFVAKTEELNNRPVKKGRVSKNAPTENVTVPEAQPNAAGDTSFMLMATSETEETPSEKTPPQATTRFSKNSGAGAGEPVRFAATLSDGSLEVSATSSATSTSTSSSKNKEDVKKALNRAGDQIKKAKSNLRSNDRGRGTGDWQEAIKEATEARSIIDDSLRDGDRWDEDKDK